MSEVSANPQSSGNRKCDETAAKAPNENDKGNNEPPAPDLQRAIEGIKGLGDEELQRFFSGDEFLETMDVVDAWGGEEDTPKSDTKDSRSKDKDRSKTSRERPRKDRKSSHSRDRPKRDDRRREDSRRDPSKSSKDIERDKMRTKKDTDSKILAEKEKAIKHLLESDNVVPPGTEVEVIQDITDKQQHTDRGQHSGRSRKSRERRRSQERQRASPSSRRRSNDRIRLSPHRRISDERRQIRLSPEPRRRNVPTPPLRRSWEQRASRDRSLERHRRREERELRLAARRSRSRERQRSRSVERYRKRWSRSPVGRRNNSPRRHSRSRSRSIERRTRKRSPFINELARTLVNEGLLPGGPSGFLPGIPPLMGPSSIPPLMAQNFSHDQPSPVNQAPFMHHPVPPSQMHIQQPGPPFVNFESRGPMPPHVNFEPGRGPLINLHQTDYAAAPIMYNQGNPPRNMQPPVLGLQGLPMPMHSPQPVPAPVPSDHSAMKFNQNRCIINIPSTVTQQQQQQPRNDPITRQPGSPRKKVKEPKSTTMTTTSTQNGIPTQRPERLITPEPPIISNSKPFEKTSLSSLLEASVSAKDSPGLPVLYPGFKPEILRNCELALRDLPAEDLRLRMKGRFFFDPSSENPLYEPDNLNSNSVLLRSGKNKLYWEETEKLQSGSEARPAVEMHQKICQTDELLTESRAVQAVILPTTADFCMQVNIRDIQQSAKEEKRPIMDRLDWNVPYEIPPKLREADDLRWSLSNSSQKRSWNRAVTPPRVIEEEREISPGRLSTSDHGSRGLNVGSSTRSRDTYSYHRSSSREHYSRDRYSPTYRRSPERNDDFHERRSDHSRGESPMVLEDSPDEIEILDEEQYSRGSDWRSRGKSTYRPSSTSHKPRSTRGKPPGRSYTGRGGFHGKF